MATSISEKGFYSRLRLNTLHEYDEIIVDFEVNVSSEILDWQFRNFDNIKFKERVRVFDVEINSGLVFENCVFEKNLIFSSVSSRNFNIELNESGCSLLFSNCKIKYLSITNNCYFKRNFRIENDSKIDKIQIVNAEIAETGFYIKDSEVNELFDITNFIGDVNIAKSNCIGGGRFETITGNVGLVKSTFDDRVKFWNLDSKTLTFNYNTFVNAVTITASKIRLLSIIGDTFEKKFLYENFDDKGQILRCFLKHLYISEAKFIEGAEIMGRGKKIKSMKLPITPNLKGVLSIKNWYVGELNISGINQNLKLLLSQLRIRAVTMIGFTNFADLTFERCEAENKFFQSEDLPNSSMIMAHNDLGKTKFIEFDFKSFDFIHSENTTFNDIKSSNVKWFADSQLRIGDDQNSNENDYRRRREVYRQLKQSLISQGNQIDSLLFKSREMKAHRNELKKSETYDLNERAIMLVNLTNDFGLNWLRAFGILVCFNFLWYLLCLPLFTEDLWYSFELPFADWQLLWSNFCNELPTIANLFNPARKFTETYGDNTSKWLVFFDVFQRVILGIFIFQIIRAFRKFK